MKKQYWKSVMALVVLLLLIVFFSVKRLLYENKANYVGNCSISDIMANYEISLSHQDGEICNIVSNYRNIENYVVSPATINSSIYRVKLEFSSEDYFFYLHNSVHQKDAIPFVGNENYKGNLWVDSASSENQENAVIIAKVKYKETKKGILIMLFTNYPLDQQGNMNEEDNQIIMEYLYSFFN